MSTDIYVKIDIYTETENSFKVACVDCDMNIVKLLINTSRKKPYNKMFNIYYLETTPVFDMVDYGFEKLFIWHLAGHINIMKKLILL